VGFPFSEEYLGMLRIPNLRRLLRKLGINDITRTCEIISDNAFSLTVWHVRYIIISDELCFPW